MLFDKLKNEYNELIVKEKSKYAYEDNKGFNGQEVYVDGDNDTKSKVAYVNHK